jgi:hypothetical protein
MTELGQLARTVPQPRGFEILPRQAEVAPQISDDDTPPANLGMAGVRRFGRDAGLRAASMGLIQRSRVVMGGVKMADRHRLTDAIPLTVKLPRLNPLVSTEATPRPGPFHG